MDLRLQFSLVKDDEFDFNSPESATFVGMSSSDIEALVHEVRLRDPAATISVELGSAGKGASGPALQLVLHIGETVLNDGASAFAWGSVLWALVNKVQEHCKRQLKTQDPESVRLLASAACPVKEVDLAGARVTEAICLTSSPGMGADARDIWLTTIVFHWGDVRAIFTSCDGTVLGDVSVPAKWNPERGSIDGEEVSRLFRRMNDH